MDDQILVSEDRRIKNTATLTAKDKKEMEKKFLSSYKKYLRDYKNENEDIIDNNTEEDLKKCSSWVSDLVKELDFFMGNKLDYRSYGFEEVLDKYKLYRNYEANDAFLTDVYLSYDEFDGFDGFDGFISL